MKVAILGATGKTGLELVKQSLQRGHQVTALVRSPEKLASFSNDEKFKAVKCDIMNVDELAANFEGKDCVLSALGYVGIPIFKISLYIDSMKSIVSAMRKSNVKRLLCVSSYYSKPYQPDYPLMYRIILRPMIGRHLDDMNEMEEFLFKEASDIDFTIVRPPGLLDEPLKDAEIIVKPDAYHQADAKTTKRTPRANVAKFMLDELEKNEYVKKGVAIDLPAA